MAAIVPISLYTVAILECFTLGFSSAFAYDGLLTLSKIDTANRHRAALVHVTLVAGAIVGHLCTIPALIFASHKRKRVWLIPYLVWRLVLTVLVPLPDPGLKVPLIVFYACIAVWFKFENFDKNDDDCIGSIVIPSAFLVGLGMLMFSIVLCAYRRLGQDRFLHAQLATGYL